MGFIINKDNSSRGILKKVKRKKANEKILLPKDEKIKTLGIFKCEHKSFKASGGDSEFMSWQIYSSYVKKILYEKYSFDFNRKWNISKEKTLHDNYENKVPIEVSVNQLKIVK